MINDEGGEVAEETFQALLSRCQIGLETSMKGSGFISGCVNLLRWKCRIINFKRVGLFIDSRDWIRNKKATINLINKKIINSFNTL